MTVQITHVLVPIDHSADAEVAVDFAALVAGSLGARITLLHVIEPPTGMVGMVPGATADGELASLRAIASDGLSVIVSALRARGSPRVDAATVVAPAVTVAIVAFGTEHAVDLIVMATHARSGVPRLVFGSVTEEVLRRATCPVLTVHLPSR